MSFITELALSTVVAFSPQLTTCSWDKPGVNPYQGNVVAALENYRDMTNDTRAALKAKMVHQKYDDVVIIRRDTIKGKDEYYPDITDMHFGKNKVCKTVTRAKWTTTAEQRALVYCAKDECIIVPLICRNVSRVRLKNPPVIIPPVVVIEPQISQGPPIYLPPGPAYTPPGGGGFYIPPGGGGFYIPPYSGWGSGYPHGGSVPPTSGSGKPPVVTTPPVAVPPMVVTPPVTNPPVITPPVDLLPPTYFPPSPPDNPTHVPEPETYMLFLLGLAAMLLTRRPRK